jgi:hypothetical protein
MGEVNSMNTRRWYFKNNYTEYQVLFEDDGYILVRNLEFDSKKWPEYGPYSFGLSRDFGTLYGFPVNQSCLKIGEAKNY